MQRVDVASVVSNRRRWLILLLGLAAQAAASSCVYGVPFLVPTLRASLGLSLAQAGVVVAAPTAGLLLTLIAWGALADRYGERVVIASGIAGCAVFTYAATVFGHNVGVLIVLLALAGAASGSVNAASGRVVLGWFAAHERGFAMSVRQTAQPIGVALASLALPVLAGAFGFRAALIVPASLCAAAAIGVAVFVVDPPRPARSAAATQVRSPYRTPVLWRLHSASALLVIPQFAVSTFSLEYLVRQQHWPTAVAGWSLAAVQLVGAGGRLGSGWWSDRVASRLRPMRQLAVASAAMMIMIAVGDRGWSWLAVLGLALGAVITVADNGLGYASVAEIAGSAWAGRALGTQNTAQNIAAAATPPLLGTLIGASDYAVGFGVVAIFGVLAVFVTPVAAEEKPL